MCYVFRRQGRDHRQDRALSLSAAAPPPRLPSSQPRFTEHRRCSCRFIQRGAGDAEGRPRCQEEPPFYVSTGCSCPRMLPRGSLTARPWFAAAVRPPFSGSLPSVDGGAAGLEQAARFAAGAGCAVQGLCRPRPRRTHRMPATRTRAAEACTPLRGWWRVDRGRGGGGRYSRRRRRPGSICRATRAGRRVARMDDGTPGVS